MSTKKTAKKMQARDVEVGNRTLEGVLIELAEQAKETRARAAELDERCARALQEIERLSVKMDATLATLSSLNRDHMGLAKRTVEIDGRVEALEKKAS